MIGIAQTAGQIGLAIWLSFSALPVFFSEVFLAISLKSQIAKPIGLLNSQIIHPILPFQLYLAVLWYHSLKFLPFQGQIVNHLCCATVK